MKGFIRAFLAAVAMVTLFTMPVFAADASENADDIVRITDEDMPVAATFTVADDVTLPVTMTITSKSNESYQVCIEHNGQSFSLLPGRYKVTKVIDGNGKKLDDGANLTIRDRQDEYYLDFKKPDDGLNVKFDWLGFLATNAAFIVLAFIAVKIFKKYREHIEG